MNEQLLAEAFKPMQPPARLVICREEMDESCAQEAADRAGIPIAWMPAPDEYRLAWMIAGRGSNGQSTASQYFVEAEGGAAAIEVSTILPALAPSTDPVMGTVSDATDTATIRRNDLFGVTELSWSHEGITYVLMGVGVGPDTAPLANAWQTVRYASPRDPG